MRILVFQSSLVLYLLDDLQIHDFLAIFCLRRMIALHITTWKKTSQIKQETELLTYPMSLSLLSLPSQRSPHPFTSYRNRKQAYVFHEGLFVDFDPFFSTAFRKLVNVSMIFLEICNFLTGLYECGSCECTLGNLYQ